MNEYQFLIGEHCKQVNAVTGMIETVSESGIFRGDSL
jgi:hypothetical protein